LSRRDPECCARCPEDEGEGGELGTACSLSETSSTAPYAAFVHPVFKPIVRKRVIGTYHILDPIPPPLSP